MGEVALMALPAVGTSGVVVGVDIAPAMLVGARDRLKEPLFYRFILSLWTARRFRSKAVVSMTSYANLVCSFSWTPLAAWRSSIAW
jgi:hypothetical protein